MTEDATAFIRRLIGAWDCCGTCAGGVLAARDAEVEQRGRVAALREAAEAEELLEGPRTRVNGRYVSVVALRLRERADREEQR